MKSGTNLEKHMLRLQDIKSALRIMEVRAVYIVIPVFLSLFISLLGGISLGLLVPIAKGIAGGDFSFIGEIHAFRWMISLFPGMLDPAHASDKSIFMLLVAIIFVATILKNILTYIKGVVSSYYNGQYGTNMKRFIFNRYLTFGKLFFDRTSQGYLNTLLDYDVIILKLLDAFQEAVLTFFMLAAYIFIMCMISWKLTVFTLIVFPVLYYSLRWLITRLKKTAKISTEAQIKLNKNVFNILSCIPLIKAYSKEEEMRKRYYSMTEQLRILQFKTSRIKVLPDPIQETIIVTALLAMITFAIFAVIKGQVTRMSTFIVFLYIAQKILPMFRVFNNFMVALAQTQPPLKKVLTILDDKDKFCIAEGNKEFRGLSESITINRLNFSYVKEKPVLNDLSLSIEKGKTTAIVGPSGSGKTTLISLILRFYACPPSTISIDGTDIREFSLISLRANMALMSQNVWLFDDTLRNNIVFGMDSGVTESKLEDALKKAQLHEFVMSLPEGLNTYIGDMGIQLSGGEKQRVALARAFLKGADILILDEATSSLDTKTEKLIQQAIDEVIRDKTAIVIAHRLSTVKRADKIAVLKDGRTVEEGTLDALLEKQGEFYQYWKEQQFY